MLWWVVLVAMGLGMLYQARTTADCALAARRVRHRRGGAGVDAGSSRRRLIVSKQKNHHRGHRPRCVIGGVPRLGLVVPAVDGADGHGRSASRRAISKPIVSASGKIQPKRFVNISADTSGRVVNLAVNEGDRVTPGSS